MYINYYAPDSKLYPKVAVNKADFRTWALADLETNYPTYTVQVLATDSCCQVTTDDIANWDSMQVYCSKLWLRWYNANTP